MNWNRIASLATFEDFHFFTRAHRKFERRSLSGAHFCVVAQSYKKSKEKAAESVRCLNQRRVFFYWKIGTGACSWDGILVSLKQSDNIFFSSTLFLYRSAQKSSFYRKKWRFFFDSDFSMEIFPWLGQLLESYILMKKWCDLLHENEFFPLKSRTLQSKITDSKPRWIYSAREKVMRRKRRSKKKRIFWIPNYSEACWMFTITRSREIDSWSNKMWFLFVITF